MSLFCLRRFTGLHHRNMCQKAGSEVSQNSKTPPVFRLPSNTLIEDSYLSNIKERVSHNRYKNYPGAGLHKCIKPPKRLIQAAITLSKKYPVKNVHEEGKKLQQYLWSRRAPPEHSDVQKTMRGIEQRLLYAELQDADVDSLTSEELEKVQQKTIEKTRRATYHWKPLEFDAYLSVVYMSRHLVSNYAILYSIMQEIASTDPDFKPTSMLDFGSGLATSVWVANELWESISVYYCWDKSADISTLARLLLQDGKDYADMIYPGVYFRQQFARNDAKQSAGFDLVVCSHTLFELPNQRTRLQYIDNLWSQTNHYLILADNGTVHGHRLIEEARIHILQNYTSEEQRGHVTAPCGHDMPCDLINNWSTMRPCNFEVSYRIGSVIGQTDFFKQESSKANKTFTRYSYVVLKKGQPVEAHRYPRVLALPQKRKTCIQCLMCLTDSKVRHINVHSKIVNNYVFKLAKNSIWGTRLPIKNWENLELTTKKDDDTEDVSESESSNTGVDALDEDQLDKK